MPGAEATPSRNSMPATEVQVEPGQGEAHTAYTSMAGRAREARNEMRHLTWKCGNGVPASSSATGLLSDRVIGIDDQLH